MTKNAVAIIGKDGSRVELDADFTGVVPQGFYSVQKVIWEDGSWSWGKSWWFGNNEELSMTFCRVGAGAYGDMTVWEHPVCPYTGKTRE